MGGHVWRPVFITIAGLQARALAKNGEYAAALRCVPPWLTAEKALLTGFAKYGETRALVRILAF
jgi:hypothetical protein